MARILITDGEQRSSLAAVRSLGRAGHEVWVSSAHPRPLAGASRYAKGVVRVRDGQASPDGFQADLDLVVREKSMDVVLPMTDASAPLVLDIRDGWPGVVVPFPAREEYDRISDKGHLLGVASTLGVPVPRQFVVDSPTSDQMAKATEWASDFGYSVVLKPTRSAVWSSGRVSRFGVHIAISRQDMVQSLARYPAEAYPLLLQQRIHGPGAGVFMLANEGRPIAAFAHRRIREKPPTGGVSVYRESVSVPEDLRRHSAALLEAFRWSGVAMVEFKIDQATGDPYLMEVNGRFWGSLQLAIDAGVDFPDLLVRQALGEQVGARDSYRVGLRSRWLWGDVDHVIWMLRASKQVRGAHPELPGRLRSVGSLLFPWRPGDRLEVARLSDPRPFLRESLQWVLGVTGR